MDMRFVDQKNLYDFHGRPAKEYILLSHTIYMVKLISHRGKGFGYKENTLEAIKAACKSKTDAVEFDIRIYKGQYIIQHNKYSPAKKTFLKDILLYCKKKQIMVDVKDFGQEEKLLKMLKGHNYIIVSWNIKILKKIHQLNPKIKLSYSYRPKTTKLPSLKLYSINIPWYQATNKFIKEINSKGIQINIFTVNNKRTFNHFKNKVDMIFTDKPKLNLN